MKKKQKNLELFMNWLWEKHILYGNAFSEWWMEEGAESFIKWASKRNMKFLKEITSDK